MPGMSGINGHLDNASQVTYAKYNGSQGLSAQLPWGFDYDSKTHPVLVRGVGPSISPPMGIRSISSAHLHVRPHAGPQYVQMSRRNQEKYPPGKYYRSLALSRDQDTIAEPAGAILHVWRQQGWFVNMFELDSIDAGAKSVKFATAESHGWTHPKVRVASRSTPPPWGQPDSVWLSARTPHVGPQYVW